VERPAVATAFDLGLGLARLLERRLAHHVGDRVEAAADGLKPLKVGFGQLDG
jgi:hypothetical protein